MWSTSTGEQFEPDWLFLTRIKTPLSFRSSASIFIPQHTGIFWECQSLRLCFSLEVICHSLFLDHTIPHTPPPQDNNGLTSGPSNKHSSGSPQGSSHVTVLLRERGMLKKEEKKRAFSEFVFALSCFFGQLKHGGVPFSRLDPLVLALHTGYRSNLTWNCT